MSCSHEWIDLFESSESAFKASVCSVCYGHKLYYETGGTAYEHIGMMDAKEDLNEMGGSVHNWQQKISLTEGSIKVSDCGNEGCKFLKFEYTTAITNFNHVVFGEMETTVVDL